MGGGEKITVSLGFLLKIYVKLQKEESDAMERVTPMMLKTRSVESGTEEKGLIKSVQKSSLQLIK